MHAFGKFLVFALVLSSHMALALPIDWGGSLGYDTTLINNYRRTNDNVVKTPGAYNGTQGIETGDNSAHFQTYLFRLNPTLIVNDSITVKGELSTGHIRGGFMGDNSTQNQNPTGNNSYFHTTSAQNNALNVNQLYAEIYADTALIKVGRFTRHYGLGVILNNGDKSWDRFFTLYDGIQGEMKIGNFSLTPHWAKLSTYDDASGNVQPNGSYDVREVGLTAMYDNKEKNTIMGIAYSKRFSEAKNTLYNSSQDNGTQDFNRGKTEVVLLDAYLEKKWEKVKVAVEVPTMSGEYGNVYSSSEKAKISTSGIILETVYSPNIKWDFGFHGGQIAGDKGDTGKFEGLYLHPNYHVAEIMFRYNFNAFNTPGKSVFDSSIANARYLKFFTNYKSDKWNWKMALIMAKALETAKAGRASYNHEENYRFNSTKNQSDDYGYEVDLGFDYMWNPNLTITGFFGYWFVGEYYAYTNTSDNLGLANVMASGLRMSIDF